MSDFLEQKRNEIDKRLRELKPLVEEFAQLEAAAAALRQVNGAGPSAGSASSAARTRPVVRRQAAKRSGTAASGRPGRRKGTGTRTLQTLELVQSAPEGITIPEIATKMGIKQNYLYRVLPALQKEGKVRKRGKAWVSKDAAA